MKKILLLLLNLSVTIGLAQGQSLFDQGKAKYDANNFQEAITIWLQILETGEHSAALYHNLGNAYYKQNQIGPSIYYYEKALQLAPGDSDTLNNLAFAENATIDAIEPLPETIFAKWYKGVSGILSYEGWAVLTVIASLCTVAFFLIYYFGISERKKRLFFAGAIVAGIFLLGGLVMAFQTYDDFISDRPAIIFAESTNVKSEPTVAGEVSFVLHEGTKVQVLAEDQQWVRIQLVDGKDGWIPSSDLKQL